ncbi:MAG: FxsA family protein [Rhodospirillaceae bacterium]|nr:FxsA family protein [Rhodospirillaceae bacterium]
MPFPFALLLLAFPLLELAGLIVAGSRMGALPVLAWVVLSAIIGANILRIAGWATTRKIQDAMRKGSLPLAEMLSGAALSMAAILLILPGFISDAIGLLLLIGPFRRVLGGLIVTRATRPPGTGDSSIIEGEFTIVDTPPPADSRPSSGSFPPPPEPPQP